MNAKNKYQVVKVSPGGSLPGGEGEPPARSFHCHLTPPHPLIIPGSLEPPWGLRKPPARSPHPLSIPRTFLGPQEAPSTLPSLPACSPRSDGQGRVGVCYTMFWGLHHLCGSKGLRVGWEHG